MANSNVLEGWECPDCASEGPFRIIATCTAVVDDDGVYDAVDYAWDDDSRAECLTCRRYGTVVDFQLLVDVKPVEE